MPILSGPADGAAASAPQATRGGGTLRGPVLPGDRVGGPGEPQGVVPGVRSVGDPQNEKPEKPAPSNRPPGIVPAGPAVRETILAAARGDGFRIGVFGDTGSGKTFAMNEVVRLYLRHTPNWVFVVDGKPAPGFRGYPEFPDLEAFARKPPIGHRCVVFRGDVFEAQKPDPEEYARFAWRQAYRKRRSMLVADEIRESLGAPGYWRRGCKWLPLVFTEGRSPGLSIVWGTQEIQDAPREAFNQSDEVWVFRLVGLGIDRLAERGYLSHGVEKVIPRLPGRMAPPAARGCFVRLVRGVGWDGRIYRF